MTMSLSRSCTSEEALDAAVFEEKEEMIFEIALERSLRVTFGKNCRRSSLQHVPTRTVPPES